MPEVLSVSEITRAVKILLEDNFSDVAVEGEISNFKKHLPSGHWYFTLKDQNAQISCTMWRGMNSYVPFSPEDGMKVIITGKITVYPPRGNYQLDVRSMKPSGAGELQAAFERLKQKLYAEGLFDDRYKKPIPKMPKKIGVVTAIGGAALQDMINIGKRRYPLAELVVYPSKVQGAGAAENIAEGIEALNSMAEVDVIIIGRGGGSLEDLWAFNEEIVARAVFGSVIPVISAVGHEIDYTISDFASDLRAPTPSAAMELATPDIRDLASDVKDFSDTFTDIILYILGRNKTSVSNAIKGYGFRIPADIVRMKNQQTDSAFYKIEQAMRHCMASIPEPNNILYRIEQNALKKVAAGSRIGMISYKIEKEIDSKIATLKNKILVFEAKLESGDFNKILKKGFALVKQNGAYITRAARYEAAMNHSLRFYDGEVEINSVEGRVDEK